MKKLFLTILLISLCSISFAALQADAVWEVRTTGADTNGGCYDYGGTGTDYSQQDAAQLSLTDLANASNTTLTSATGGFTAVMVDNCIQINSGTNALAGFYEITGYTNTNTVTIDRTCSTGGDMSDGVGSVGGALAHIGKAAESVDMGNRVYVKAGTYQKYGANDYVMLIADDQNFGASVEYKCYKTTRDDNPQGADRCVLDGDGGGANEVTDVINTAGNDGWRFSNFIIQNAAAFNIDDGGRGGFFYCRITGAGSNGFDSGDYGFYFSECDLNTSYCGTGFVKMYASYVHDNGNAIYATSASFSIFDSNTDMGARTNGSGIFANNILYNNSRAIYAHQDNSANVMLGIYVNNIWFSNTTNLQVDNSNIRPLINNITKTYTSTWDGVRNMEAGLILEPSFNNAASGDFTVTTGSGAIDIGESISTDQGVVGTYKMNIGVDQDDTVTAGGGGASSYGFSN